MSMGIGRTRRGRPVSLSETDRSTHVHVLGASGYGKSTLLEGMIRADILAGRGVCLIDPHGTLADSIVAWCASRNIEKHRRVHLIEPARAEWCVGFNPLRLDGRTLPSARVDAMVSGCAQVWGGEALTGTPLLKKCLRAVFYALAVQELTLAEAPELISSTGTARRTLTENLPDYVFGALWEEFNALRPRDFAEQFSSTSNRLIEFLSSPVLRRIVGQRTHTLDLFEAMNNDEIIILNLAPGGSISADNARLLGTLITSELFLLSKMRTPEQARAHPFYCYIDECYDFLTSDIENMLDQTRKFGVHLVLSHQRLGQLRTRSESIYNGVMAGGQTKIVFGNLEDEDAEVMARQILRDSFDLERPKHSLDKEVVVDEVPFWLESESWSDTEGRTASSSDSGGWSASSSTSADAIGQEMGSSISAGQAGSFTSGESTTASHTHSQGRAQTLKPVRATAVMAVHSLEEEQHRAILRLRKLPVGTAIVRPRGRPALYVKVPLTKPPIVWPELLSQFRTRVSVGNPSVSTVLHADAEIVVRQEALHDGRRSKDVEEPQWYEPVVDP